MERMLPSLGLFLWTFSWDNFGRRCPSRAQRGTVRPALAALSSAGHERAPALIERPVGLLQRHLADQAVDVVAPTGLRRRLHLEDVDRTEAPPVGADRASAEQGILRG